MENFHRGSLLWLFLSFWFRQNATGDSNIAQLVNARLSLTAWSSLKWCCGDSRWECERVATCWLYIPLTNTPHCSLVSARQTDPVGISFALECGDWAIFFAARWRVAVIFPRRDKFICVHSHNGIMVTLFFLCDLTPVRVLLSDSASSLSIDTLVNA